METMTRRVYSLAAGTLLLLAAICFFLLIVAFDELDAFFPAMLALVSFVAGVGVLVSGLSER